MRAMQLERLLHAQGFGSRKECRALIRAGLVSVAGTPCEDPQADFDPGSQEVSDIPSEVRINPSQWGEFRF